MPKWLRSLWNWIRRTKETIGDEKKTSRKNEIKSSAKKLFVWCSKSMCILGKKYKWFFLDILFIQRMGKKISFYRLQTHVTFRFLWISLHIWQNLDFGDDYKSSLNAEKKTTTNNQNRVWMERGINSYHFIKWTHCLKFAYNRSIALAVTAISFTQICLFVFHNIAMRYELHRIAINIHRKTE